MKKIVIITGVIVVLIGGIWAVRRPSGGDAGVSPLPSTSASPSVSVVPSKKPIVSVKPTPIASKTPGITFREVEFFTVSIANFVYNPATVSVTRGDMVTFRNNDSVLHTATAVNGTFSSGIVDPGETWTLDTAQLAPGTYEYRCTFHTAMTGILIVK